MGGRPTSLTDEVKDIICSHLANGATYQIACQAAGITRATAYNWKARGEAGEPKFDAFLDEVERARARFEVLCLQRLNALDEDGGRASGSVVRALTWLLERTRNDRYGPSITVKVAEAREQMLDVAQRVCAPEDFARLCSELARGGAEAAAEPAAIH